MAKILIVDDDPDMLSLVSEVLENENYEVEAIGDSTAAKGLLKYNDFDLLIFDWDMPGISGLELCSSYRSNGGQSPVIMFTGKSESKDKVRGLESGADDFISKPILVEELVARVKAHLRRSGGKYIAGDKLLAGPISLNPESHRVWNAGTEIKLLPREFAILELFLRYPTRVFSADAIITRVWSSKDGATPETVRGHIMNLRKKLSPADILETVHSVGYRLKENSE